MSSQSDISVKLRLTAEGIREATSDSEKLNQSLERGQTIAKRPKAVSAGYKAAQSTMENVDYGVARGTIGTGAGARDFAKESQGLGGLVRLYATWAANVYAVSAAFNALSNAADTTNMIKGMDQLGVSSGVALGSLAKKFADATGGAISFQEAVGATTKAISAGLSTKQFEQIGEVATKASRALGVNMSDAVSRLTRGITKIEPELLDELGIFTKVGQASEEYAKRVGKSVTSLTDFEKRQAFANAVLKEGRDKFADINIEANPYDKLAASVKNLTQNGLELINKVLGPIIGLLSSSPVALTGVMAGLGLMLVKQAMPAIGEYRESLSKAADDTTKKWQKKSDDLKKIEKEQFQYILNLSEQQADSKLASFEKAENRIAKSRAKSVLDTKAQSILAKSDYNAVSKEDIKYLRDTAKVEKSAGNTQLAKEYSEAANALKQWVAAEKEHVELLKQINAQVDKGVATASKLSAQGYARDQLESARKGKAKSSIVSGVAQDVSLGTFGEAWANMNKSIKDEKLTGADKIFTKIGGAAVIATTGITRAVSALSGVLGWVGIAIATFTTLYSLVSTNRVEEEKLSKAIEYADEVTKTATGTFAKFGNTLTTEALLAKANAMGALGDSVTETISKFSDFQKASGFIDNTWESVKHLFGLFGGFSKQDYVADSLSKQVMKMLDNLDDPELKKTAETKLKGLLDVKSVNIDSLRDGIAKIDPFKLKEIPKITEEIETKAKATTLAITSLKDGFKGVDTAFLALSNTLISQDPMQKYAQSLVTQAKTMSAAFKDPSIAAATFGDILKDNTKLAAFPPEVAAQIMSVAGEYKKLSTDIEESNAKVKELENELKKGAGSFTAYFTSRKMELELKVKADTDSLKTLGKNLQEAAAKSMEYAFNIATAKAGLAMKQAAIDADKTLTGLLPKSQATVKLQMDLELSSIAIRKQEITAIYALTQEYKKANAAEVVKSAQAELDKQKPNTKEYTEAEKNLETAKSNQKALNDPNLTKNKDKYEKTPEMFKQLSEQSGFSSQMAALIGQEKGVKLKSAVDKLIVGFDEETKAAQDRVSLETKKFEKDVASDDYRRKSLEEQDKVKQDYLDKTSADRLRVDSADKLKNIAVTNKVVELAGPKSEIAKVGNEDLTRKGGYQEQLNTAKELFAINEATNKSKDATALIQSTVTRDFSRQEVLAQQALETAKLKNDTDLKSIESAQQMLDIRNGLGFVNAQDYETQSNALKARKVEIDYVQQLIDLEEERRKKLAAIAEEIAKAGGRDSVEPTRLGQLDADSAAANQKYKDQRAGVESVTQALREQGKLTDSMSVRMKGLNDIVEGSFVKMGSAIAEFTKTGKLDFAGLIDSMIADLLRFELEAQMKSAFKAMGGLSGIGSAIGSLFSGSTAGAPVMDAGITTMATMAAKGHAYDYGVEAFAKGGTFTNSIVDSPTMFKFAKGTGLMGEAGPEAIMPLKRDSQGNLGIRGGDGGGSNVEVTVHNYGNEKAETKESTDARGNRKIDVIIGEVSAGDMNRSGSSSQKALGGTYGLRPQLIRR